MMGPAIDTLDDRVRRSLQLVVQPARDQPAEDRSGWVIAVQGEAGDIRVAAGAGLSLLKLVTRTSSFWIAPADAGATTIAYGFWSPLAGTVVLKVVSLWIEARNPSAACAAFTLPRPSDRLDAAASRATRAVTYM